MVFVDLHPYGKKVDEAGWTRLSEAEEIWIREVGRRIEISERETG